MAPAKGSAATALLFVSIVLLLASPGVQGLGESCMEDCLKECAKQNAEQEDASKKLDATQCEGACSVACPMYHMFGKPEDVKRPAADDGTPPAAKSAAAAAAAAAGKNGRNVPAHYVCFLIHVAFATLWY